MPPTSSGKLLCDSSQFVEDFTYEDLLDVVELCLTQHRNVSSFEMVGFEGMEMDSRMGRVMTDGGYVRAMN